MAHAIYNTLIFWVLSMPPSLPKLSLVVFCPYLVYISLLEANVKKNPSQNQSLYPFVFMCSITLKVLENALQNPL